MHNYLKLLFVVSLPFSQFFSERLIGKWEGYTGLGLEVRGEGNGDSLYYGKLQYETKRENQTKAVIELTADESRNEIQASEIYFDYKAEDESKYIFGKQKKVFGNEFDQSREQRLMPNRSFVYQKLNAFNYTGRELGFVYKPAGAKENYEYGIFYNQSLDLSLTYRKYLGKILEDLDSQLWMELVADKVGGNRQYNWLIAYGLYKDSADRKIEFETFAGVDPHQSAVDLVYSNGNPTHFFSTKYLHSFSTGSSDVDSFWPLYGISIFLHDVSHSSYMTISPILGSNYFFNKQLKLSFSLEFNSTNSIEESNEWSYANSLLYFSTDYFF